MAKINGWDKIGVNRWTKKGIVLDIHLAKSDHHYITKPGWNLTLIHRMSNQYFEDIIFPTKEAALDYAMKYMRAN